MTPDEVRNWVARQQAIQPVLQTIPAASAQVIAEAERTLGPLPQQLRELLQVTNGLSCGRIRVFSAFDEALPKKTWESLQRANDPGKTSALGGDDALLHRFLVFADIGRCFLLWDRTDGTVWYQDAEAEEIRRTTLGFYQALEGAFAEYE